MKRTLQTVFLLCLIFAGQMANQALAVTAYPYPVQVKQPDGTTITVVMQGDERVKWAKTTDGYTIMYNAKGIFEYATQDSKGDLALSGIAVSDISARKSNELNFLAKTSKGLLYSASQVSMMKSIYAIRENEVQKAFPTTGSRKLVCILMGYKDKAFTKTQADFNNLYNQVGYSAGGATGSVKDFYLESSYGQFDLSVTVAGPYTAANNMSYYGGNDASGNDSNPRALVSEAINAADASVNFANFDNDNDGAVDGVYIIYAGYGEEAGGGVNCIWAHAWSLATSVTKDGKSISKYSCSAELSGSSGTTLTAIGVICHEFGHVLGAPDYYDTNYATGGQFDGTGKWDMMASGSWNNNGITPAQHNVYTKVKVYGWATATVLSSAAAVTVTSAQANKSFYQINSTTANEYWLIENRQQVGFDTNIPGHGLMIYHVHKDIGTAGNAINATYPQKMYPVCANATSNPGTTAATYGTINGAGCPFPGSGAKTSFTDATTPNMKSWAGANTAKPITNIVENTSTKTITFSFMGGVPVDPTAPTATTVAASSILTTTATLNATVTANNATTTVTFEYGTTTSYGSTINGTPNSITGATATNITAALTGLTANTTYNYRVKAVNSVGTTYGSNMTFKTTANQTSLELPVTENFATSSLPIGWTTQNVGTGITERWGMSNTANAGGAAYELKCSYQNLNPATTRVITPAINTVGVSQVTFSFKHMLDAYAAGATLRVQTSNDKSTWTNTTWSVAISSTNIAAATVNVTVTTNLNSATTYFALVVDGNLYQIDYWYIDNISITSGSTTTIPTVSTTAVSSITSSTASSGGNVTADGGATVTERGICYATTQTPTTASSKVTSGTGTGTYIANMSGLAPSTTYYVRAYAINSNGTAYGAQQSFTTLPGGLTYCTSKGSNSTYEWIDLVQFAGINRTSTSDGGYKDNTSMVGTVTRGTTVPIYFSAGMSSAYSEYWAIWIDYNQNGTFDTNEKVVTTSSSSTATLSANIAIPTTALLGNTRMRVSMKYSAAPTACETFSYGEVEDYTVNITAASPSSGIESSITENVEVFTFFPNPVSERLTVQLKQVEGNATLKIFDIRGALLKKMIISEPSNDVDVSELAKGTYLISIDGVNKPEVKKFIKL
ncbi:MAG: M6 family metalloprotease domain-containing protein [Bacteroidales bacterium]|nr:MAG: M6 family metalloprotease domain-containing protein [Bacteroidales bacterium]